SGRVQVSEPASRSSPLMVTLPEATRPSAWPVVAPVSSLSPPPHTAHSSAISRAVAGNGLRTEFRQPGQTATVGRGAGTVNRPGPHGTWARPDNLRAHDRNKTHMGH